MWHPDGSSRQSVTSIWHRLPLKRKLERKARAAGRMRSRGHALNLVRRVKPHARRVENAREVHSDCRAEPCPPTRAAAGRGPCLAVLFPPRTDGRSGSPARRAAGSGAPGNAAYARRSGPSHHGCGLCPAFRPVSSWVPAAPRTGRSRQCDGRRVKPPIAIRGHGHAGALGHHGGAGGRFKFAAPALRLLAFWVERWASPPAPSR